MIGPWKVPALGPRGEGWVIGQIVLLVAIAATGVGALARAAPALILVSLGGGLIIVGLLLAGLGIVDLGANLTPFPRPRPTATLVERGAYRYLRHPIYSGLVLAGWGWSVAAGSLAALVLTAALALLLDLKARREEAWLLQRLPGYGAYRARTHKFVPGIY
ncbi:MAG TPA: isoprenylcysteine carboxylmethyltransferase family protein [Candidatus Limnocylindrales bacterium]|nr:isoprenylcysteine carboxylmethyltransferase family protein [Candidatus Limnocylindrales bacterium]